MKPSISTSALLICIIMVGLIPATIHAQDAPEPIYAERGTQPVGVVDFTIENGERPLNVTMWYPALNPDGLPEVATYQVDILEREGQALRDGTPDIAGGPYPVVYFSHGLGGSRFENTFYSEHLASWGFVVFAADHPGSTFFDITEAADVIQSFAERPHEMLRVIEYSDELNAAGDYAGLLDMENLAVSGYSFGGYTALAAGGANINFNRLLETCSDASSSLCDELAAQFQALATSLGLDTLPEGLWPSITDPRIKAVLGMAPVVTDILGATGEGAAGLTAPLMLMVGTADPYVSAETHTIPAFENATSDIKSLVFLENASHNIYVNECTEQWIELGFSDACTDAVWEMSDAHTLIKHFATAFFLAHLKNDTEAAAALLPDAVDFVGVDYRMGAD